MKARNIAAAAIAAAALLTTACSGAGDAELEAYGGRSVEALEPREEEAYEGVADYSGHKGFELSDGSRFYDEDEAYTAQEADAAEKEAAAAASEFCGIVFGYKATDGDITQQLYDRSSHLEGAYGDYGNIYKVFSGTGLESEFGSYEVAKAYALDAGEYGQQMNLSGKAEVHLKSDRIPEGDYDVYVQFIMLREGVDWKVYDVRFQTLYEPGTLSITVSEENEASFDVDGTPAAFIDWRDADGYLGAGSAQEGD